MLGLCCKGQLATQTSSDIHGPLAKYRVKTFTGEWCTLHHIGHRQVSQPLSGLEIALKTKGELQGEPKKKVWIWACMNTLEMASFSFWLKWTFQENSIKKDNCFKGLLFLLNLIAVWLEGKLGFFFIIFLMCDTKCVWLLNVIEPFFRFGVKSLTL